MSQLSPFRKRSVPTSTREELKQRGLAPGIQWNGKKFPWVHLTSLCSTCKDSDRFTVLTSLRGALYEPGFVRPLPTIQSVEVKKQGELGTTRRAIVKIVAYTDDQLVELQRCYFLPAMGVRVEWGWSIAANTTPIPAVLGVRDYSDAKAICLMNKKEQANPNYSGLQGIVANFDYNLNIDGYWECTLEIIAAAEAVSGTKVTTYNCGCKRENNIEDEDGKKSKVNKVEPDLIAHLRDLQEKYDDIPTIGSQYGGRLGPYVSAGLKWTVTRAKLKGMKQRNESGGEGEVGFLRGWAEYFTDKYSYETFVSWGTFEAMLNALIMDLGKEGPGNRKKWLGELDSGEMLIAYHAAVQSSDPRICYVPGGNYADKIVPVHKGDTPSSAIQGTKVRLCNIMVNVIFMLGELRAAQQNDLGLVDFLDSVLKKISNACGNLWSLEVVATTECCDTVDTDIPPSLAIVDIKDYGPAPDFVVSMLPTNSFIRDFKFEMRMTDAMKTQALYSGGPIAVMDSPSGGNCDATVFKSFNIDAANRYNLAKGPPVAPSSDCAGNTGIVQAIGDLSYNGLFEQMIKEGISSERADGCRTTLSEAYSMTSGEFQGWRNAGGFTRLFLSIFGGKDQREHCKGVPLPFNFSFTVDGVGGFKFGQMVTSDRMPQSITKNFHWQITTVEHSITVQDWTTTVNTVCRYRGEI